MTRSADAFANARVENRFVGTAPLVTELPDIFQEQTYPNPVVTTLIFGNQNAKDDVPVPIGGTLRFRYYTPDTVPDLYRTYALDPAQLGTLMLKHYPDPHTERLHNQKTILPNIALGAVYLPLESGRREDVASYAGGREMLDLINEYYGKDALIMPLIAVQARRRHLLVSEDMGVGPARITFDEATTFWPVVSRKPRDVLAVCRGLTLGQNILEIKMHDRLDPAGEACQALLARLFGEPSDYVPQGRVKRALGRQVIESLGVPRLNNPELQLVGDASKPEELFRDFKEREIKIDATADPRDAIIAIPTRPREGLWVDPGFRSPVVRFRFHTFGKGADDVLVVAEKHRYVDGQLKGAHFQHKQLVRDGGSDKVLVRYEVMAPSLAELWNKLGQEPGELVGATQFAARNRYQRRVVCERTGNVFLIVADYCCADSDDRPPLSQVEIEFLGTLGFEKDAATPPDEAQIAADFDRVRQVVLESLGTMAKDSQTTKQDWLTTHA